MRNLIPVLFFCLFMIGGVVIVVPSCQNEVMLSDTKMAEIAYSAEYKNLVIHLDIATDNIVYENLIKRGIKVGDQMNGKYIKTIHDRPNIDQNKADQDMLDAGKQVKLKFPEFGQASSEQRRQMLHMFRTKENTDALSNILTLDNSPQKKKD